MDGIILIDKPKNISSFGVVHKIRKLSQIKKVGHAGTLDPNASGLLVVCLGKYTKLSSNLTSQNKTYEAVFRLGLSTSTDDPEGDILYQKSINNISQEQVILALENFKGQIYQVPPKFSAIKIGGKRAYSIARKTQDFIIPKRLVEIFDIKIINISLPDIILKITCSKGTYMRSIARDLGEILGVGGIAQEIRRTASGSFSIQDSVLLQNLNQENIGLFIKTL